MLQIFFQTPTQFNEFFHKKNNAFKELLCIHRLWHFVVYFCFNGKLKEGGGVENGGEKWVYNKNKYCDTIMFKIFINERQQRLSFTQYRHVPWHTVLDSLHKRVRLNIYKKEVDGRQQQSKGKG